MLLFFPTAFHNEGLSVYLQMNERYREEAFWCVFCIHDECWPFLELYDSHQASLTHQPLKVIPLTACQHISPNISLAPQNGHTFTLTLLAEVHQFRAKDSADMHDWLVTLRNKLQDLQALGVREHVEQTLSRDLMSTRLMGFRKCVPASSQRCQVFMSLK